VGLLIAAGADVNKTFTDDVMLPCDTPLSIAAYEGHVDVVERLIAAGADVNKTCTSDSDTPLYIAAQ